MTTTRLDYLQSIGLTVIGKLGRIGPNTARRMFDTKKYHGFEKAKLPLELIEAMFRDENHPPEISWQSVQVEIVSVEPNLTPEIYSHWEADTFVIDISVMSAFPPPRGAWVFLKQKWNTFPMNGRFRIPAKAPRGFSVNRGGSLWMLSVTSPLIEREDGYDDYHTVHTA
jgi:hypothetical protein